MDKKERDAFRKSLLDQAFGRTPSKEQSRKSPNLPSPPPAEVQKVLSPEQIRDQLSSLKGENRLSAESIKGLSPSELAQEIKDQKLLDVSDLRNHQSIIYPNPKFQDLRWHGAGVTKIIAGTGITITNTGEVPGLSDVTINASGAIASFNNNEIPAGAVDGINTIFTTVDNFVANSTHLYLNGLRQLIGVGNDYEETGANEITFKNPPQVGDIIIIDYIKA